MASVEALMKKVEADVQALSDAILADESTDQSGIREEMGKLHEQFTALITKAKAYAEKAKKLAERAEAEHENAQTFLDSAEELVDSLGGASEAMDPDQWDWGDSEEEPE